jgi:hypothetical protein
MVLGPSGGRILTPLELTTPSKLLVEISSTFHALLSQNRKWINVLTDHLDENAKTSLVTKIKSRLPNIHWEHPSYANFIAYSVKTYHLQKQFP